VAMLDQTNAIERLAFFDGQRLAAADLQGIEAFNREMRWLHNRSLHQAGIGNGFAVAGKKGDREVRIGPGYALDSDGRETVLIRDHVEPIPPVAGEPDGTPVFFDLVVSYPADADLEEAESREGICFPRGVVRLREEPLFCWVRLKLNTTTGEYDAVDGRLGLEVLQGRRIRLARIEVENCKLKRDLSTAQRRDARPPQQPRIVCRNTSVNWETWTIFGSDGSVDIGLRGEISTAGGRFANTPSYNARIDGLRPLVTTVEIDEEQVTYLLFDGPIYVEAPAIDRFTVSLTVIALRGSDAVPDSPSFAVGVDPDVILEMAREQWRVAWMGVEE
jgi:hypothetical protein